MQGVILSAGTAQGIILGDDGARYAFTPLGWRNAETRAQVGMRVDFEARGSHAVGIYPLPGEIPSPSAQPPVTPPTAPVIPPTQTLPTFPTSSAGAPPAQPPLMPPVAEGAPPNPTPPEPPTKKKFRMARRHWALAGGALAVLGVVAIALAILLWGNPAGEEIARHTHEGEVYVLVEYGSDLAIFTDSGSPVTRRDLAEDILHSYAWRQAMRDFDVDEFATVSQRVEILDDSLSDVRDISNDVVSIFDDLEDMRVNVPLLGSISAMDIVSESFDGAEETEILIRNMNSELNSLGDDTATLTRTYDAVADAKSSPVSGGEMQSLFTQGSAATRGLASFAQSFKEFVAEVEEAVAGLEGALWLASDTPVIGDSLEHFAMDVGRFGSDISILSSALGDLESDLLTLGEDMEKGLDSADKIFRKDTDRWRQDPPDAIWPPTDIEEQPDDVA